MTFGIPFASDTFPIFSPLQAMVNALANLTTASNYGNLNKSDDQNSMKKENNDESNFK